MAWCRQATSHYLNQCWPGSMPTYSVTRPQWVKPCMLPSILNPKVIMLNLFDVWYLILLSKYGTIYSIILLISWRPHSLNIFLKDAFEQSELMPALIILLHVASLEMECQFNSNLAERKKEWHNSYNTSYCSRECHISLWRIIKKYVQCISILNINAPVMKLFTICRINIYIIHILIGQI